VIRRVRHTIRLRREHCIAAPYPEAHAPGARWPEMTEVAGRPLDPDVVSRRWSLSVGARRVVSGGTPRALARHPRSAARSRSAARPGTWPSHSRTLRAPCRRVHGVCVVSSGRGRTPTTPCRGVSQPAHALRARRRSSGDPGAYWLTTGAPRLLRISGGAGAWTLVDEPPYARRWRRGARIPIALRSPPTCAARAGGQRRFLVRHRELAGAAGGRRACLRGDRTAMALNSQCCRAARVAGARGRLAQRAGVSAELHAIAPLNRGLRARADPGDRCARTGRCRPGDDGGFRPTSRVRTAARPSRGDGRMPERTYRLFSPLAAVGLSARGCSSARAIWSGADWGGSARASAP